MVVLWPAMIAHIGIGIDRRHASRMGYTGTCNGPAHPGIGLAQGRTVGGSLIHEPVELFIAKHLPPLGIQPLNVRLFLRRCPAVRLLNLCFGMNPGKRSTPGQNHQGYHTQHRSCMAHDTMMAYLCNYLFFQIYNLVHAKITLYILID